VGRLGSGILRLKGKGLEVASSLLDIQEESARLGDDDDAAAPPELGGGGGGRTGGCCKGRVVVKVVVVVFVVVLEGCFESASGPAMGGDVICAKMDRLSSAVRLELRNDVLIAVKGVTVRLTIVSFSSVLPTSVHCRSLVRDEPGATRSIVI
jgi:hypothetical protein